MILRHLAELELPIREMGAYDKPIGIRLLHEDPESGVEYYVVRYPEGLRARWHRHSVAHTIVVLEGPLTVNGELIGPGDMARYPAGLPMHHAPAPGSSCTFLMVFEGLSDVTLLPDPE
jgi:quercetin dioxygenase-like cupin family protein